MSTAVKLSDDIVKAAKKYAEVYSRSVPKQIEYWSRIGKIAEENPDLPYSFIKDILLSLDNNFKNQKLPFYLVDEKRIEMANDEIISKNQSLMEHVAFINDSLNFIDETLQVYTEKTEEELAILRLAIRCFNSISSSLLLFRRGYYQQGFALVRDIMETSFLLDLFSRDKKALNDWINVEEKERRKKYSPAKAREKLDKIDGYTEGKREEAYKLLCQYGTHPTPEGYIVFSPDGMSQIGPFPNEKLLTAGIQELVKRMASVTTNFMNNIPNGDAGICSLKLKFIKIAEKWRQKYMSEV